MSNFISRFDFKKYLDNFLLCNLFVVIFSALFFIFSLIMEINGKSTFLDIFRKIWEPFILPAISILISSSLLLAIISWLKRKLLLQEEDI